MELYASIIIAFHLLKDTDRNVIFTLFPAELQKMKNIPFDSDFCRHGRRNAISNTGLDGTLSAFSLVEKK